MPSSPARSTKPNQTILIYAGVNFVAALVTYPAGAISDRLGRKSVLLFGLGIFAVAVLGLAVADSGVAVATLFALYGAYQGIFRSTGKALATSLAPAVLQGSAVGFYASTIGMTALVASLIGGQIWVLVSPSATFLYGGIFGVIGCVALAMLVPEGVLNGRHPVRVVWLRSRGSASRGR